jgi:predicted Zn-dependent peptidase
MAVNASASSRAQWYVGAFQFSATPRVDKGVQPEELEKEIWAEVEKIKKEGVTEEEIQKAKNRGEAMFIRSLGSTMGLASRVGRADLHRGWRSILTDLDNLKKVTNDDIKRVAAKYFVKDNSLTAIYRRKMGR